MTLDEAIKHAREVAEKNRKNCKPNSIIIQNRWADSTMCAEEHEQLAGWLEELKAIREIVTLKKPDDMDIKGETVYLCPNCGAEINGKDIDFIYHCCACGQAIDLR